MSNIDNTLQIPISPESKGNGFDGDDLVTKVAKKQKQIIYEAFKNAPSDVEKELYAILHAPLVKVEFVETNA